MIVLNTKAQNLDSENASSQDIQKPPIFKFVSVSLFIIATTHLLTALAHVSLWSILDRAVSGADLVDNAMNYLPSLGFSPFVHSLTFLLLVYAGIKALEGSRFSYWLSLSLLVISPVISTFIIESLKSDFSNFSTAKTSLPAWNILFLIANPVLILVIITLVFCLVSSKKFNWPNKQLSRISKTVMAVLIITILGPVSLFSISKYIRAADTDLGYSLAQETSGYHVYRPSSLPDDLVQVTKYTPNKELAGKNNAVLVAFDTPLGMKLKDDRPRLLVMWQVWTGTDFDVYTYASTIIEGAEQPEKVVFSNAQNTTAYVTQKQPETHEIKYFTFVTKDGVLISMASFSSTVEEFIQFAELLK